MTHPISAEKALTNALGFSPIAGTISIYDNKTHKRVHLFPNLPLRKIEWEGDQIKLTTANIPSSRKFYLLYDPQFDRLLAMDFGGGKKRIAYWEFPEGSIGQIPEPITQP